MTHTRSTTLLAGAIAAVTALLPPATAGADGAPSAPPAAAGIDVHCRYEVTRTLRLDAVARTGIPVRFTCDGPARVDSLPMLRGKADDDWADLHPHGVPGITRSTPVTLTKAGSGTLRSRFLPGIPRFLRRYPRVRLTVLLGVEDDHGLMASIDSGRTVVLVR